jgi:hypothetical protein
MSTIRDWAELASQNERLAEPADRADGQAGAADSGGRRGSPGAASSAAPAEAPRPAA